MRATLLNVRCLNACRSRASAASRVKQKSPETISGLFDHRLPVTAPIAVPIVIIWTAVIGVRPRPVIGGAIIVIAVARPIIIRVRASGGRAGDQVACGQPQRQAPADTPRLRRRR